MQACLAGWTIYTAGDIVPELYFIASGTVIVTLNSENSSTVANDTAEDTQHSNQSSSTSVRGSENAAVKAGTPPLHAIQELQNAKQRICGEVCGNHKVAMTS